MGKLLFVDDAKSVHAFIGMILEGEDYKYESVFSGEEAIKKIQDSKSDEINLLFLDWEMPGLNGLEVLSRLRSQGFSLPICMLTSKNNLEDIEKALAEGANDYIMKPFTKDLLIEKIHFILGDQ